MKTSAQIKIIAAISAAAIFPYLANATVYNPSASGYWDDPATWGKTSDYDIPNTSLDTVSFSNSNSYTVTIKQDKKYKIASVTSTQGVSVIKGESGTELTVGTVTKNGRRALSFTGSGFTVNVGSVDYIKVSNTDSYIHFGTSTAELGSVNVSGNIILNPSDGSSSYKAKLSMNAVSAVVSGYLDMQTAYTSFNIASDSATSRTVNLGALQGVAGATVSASNTASKLVITGVKNGENAFATAGTYEYLGNITSGNIEMNAAKASGTTNADYIQKLSGTNSTTGTMTVKSGTLLVNNITGGIVLDGGVFGAAGDSSLVVENLTWTNGGFYFDFSQSNYEITITTLDASSLAASLLADFVFENVESGDNFTLLSLTNANSALAALDGKTQAFGDLLATFSATGNSLGVSFSQIPEPASYAAIFGALALAFAAYRRSKRG